MRLRRKDWVTPYLLRLDERIDRAAEDMYWAALGPFEQLRAQNIYEARTGLSSWTFRFVLNDEPLPDVTLKAVS